MIAGQNLSSALIEAVTAVGIDSSGAGDERASDPQYRMQPESTVQLLASTLAKLHSVAVDGMVLGPHDLVAEAQRRLDAGEPIADSLDPAYRHVSVDRLVSILADGADRIADTETWAVTIGRATLENLTCHRGRAVGFADWSVAAVADPYRDLATAATSIAADIGPGAVPALFDSYGIGRVDVIRLDWYALAAQLVAV